MRTAREIGEHLAGTVDAGCDLLFQSTAPTPDLKVPKLQKLLFATCQLLGYAAFVHLKCAGAFWVDCPPYLNRKGKPKIYRALCCRRPWWPVSQGHRRRTSTCASQLWLAETVKLALYGSITLERTVVCGFKLKRVKTHHWSSRGRRIPNSLQRRIK